MLDKETELILETRNSKIKAVKAAIKRVKQSNHTERYKESELNFLYKLEQSFYSQIGISTECHAIQN